MHVLFQLLTGQRQATHRLFIGDPISKVKSSQGRKISSDLRSSPSSSRLFFEKWLIKERESARAGSKRESLIRIFSMEPRLSGSSPRMGSVRAPPIDRTPAWPLQQSTDLGCGRWRRLLMGSQPRHCAALSRGSLQRCKVRQHKRTRLSMVLHCCFGPRTRLACHPALPARGANSDRSVQRHYRTESPACVSAWGAQLLCWRIRGRCVLSEFVRHLSRVRRDAFAAG